MSIAEKFYKILDTKGKIKQAIIDKGVEVSDDTTFEEYADKIAEISASIGPVPVVFGSGSATPAKPKFIIVYSNNPTKHQDVQQVWRFKKNDGEEFEVFDFDVQNPYILIVNPSSSTSKPDYIGINKKDTGGTFSFNWYKTNIEQNAWNSDFKAIEISVGSSIIGNMYIQFS